MAATGQSKQVKGQEHRMPMAYLWLTDLHPPCKQLLSISVYLDKNADRHEPISTPCLPACM